MSNILWKSLLISPAIVGTALMASSAVKAAESPIAETLKPETQELQIGEFSSQANWNNTQLSEQPEQIELGTTLVASSALEALETPGATEALQLPTQELQISEFSSQAGWNNTQLSEQSEQIDLGTALVASSALEAVESPGATEALQPPTQELQIAELPASNNTQLLEQIDRYSQEGQLNMGQVTSVDQLRDVDPTSWAYEALRSLVERYGCIVGYPDQTFRGNRALTRWEFAAGLNACMEQMERLIAATEAVLREDIEKLQRLMQEFEAELAALGARVDNLEGRVAFLEDHQFSTTTKLAGEVIIAGTTNAGDDNDNQAILGNRVRLVLNTSFTGQDRLVTRLASGNFERFRNNFEFDDVNIEDFDGRVRFDQVESATSTQTFNLFRGNDNDVFVDWLAYYFPIELGNTRLNTYVAGTGGIWSDITPTLNPFFEDFDGGNGALSAFATESPIYRIGGGAGGAVSFDFGLLEGILGPSTVTVGYLSGSANDPEPGAGVFNGDYAVLGQFNVNIRDRVQIGFTYVHAFHKADSPIFGVGDREGTGVVGTAAANLSRSTIVEDLEEADFDPAIPEGRTIEDLDVTGLKDKVTNTYGAQLAWRVTDWMSFSGFFAYQAVRAIGRGRSETWTYGGGFAFPDLGKEGSVLGIFAGVQPYNGRGRIGNLRFGGQNPVHIEGFYKYQITDNISITPGVIYLINPEQSDDSEDQVIGTLRTTFTF